MRTGVILAAGFGSRLQTEGEPARLKPLTPVAGRPLMLRTLASLRRAGCQRVVIVLGHGADDLRDAVSRAHAGAPEVRFVVNPRYELANGLSVLAAREEVEGEFLLTMADHVFGDEVMDIARTHAPPAGGATLLIDRKLDSIFDMDDATKVETNGDRIAAIGKTLTEYDAVDTGLFVCTPALFEALDAVHQERGDASLSEGVAALSARGTMTVLDIGDGFWQDVDTPEMMGHAAAMLRARGE